MKKDIVAYIYGTPIYCQSLCADTMLYSCANNIDIEVLSSFHVDAVCQAKLANYHRDIDKVNTLLGRYLLRYAMGDDSHLEMGYKSYGKPFLPKLHFNISHTDSLVALILSPHREVGIDCEDIAAINLPDFNHCFGNEEWHYIHQASDPHYAFYRLWTRKEALLKATGIGLIDHLPDINVLEDVISLNGHTWEIGDSSDGNRMLSWAVSSLPC